MTGCPSREDLRRYLAGAGSLGDVLGPRIEAHVEACAGCQEVLDRLSGAGAAPERRGATRCGAEALSGSGVALLGWIKRSVPPELEERWGPGRALEGLARALDRGRGWPEEPSSAGGGDRGERAEALLGRARRCLDQRRYAAAERLYRRALVLRAATLPPGHPEVARDFRRLAAVVARQGRYDQAEPLYRQALEIFTATLPAGHPELASTLIGLAAIEARQGGYGAAVGLGERAAACLAPGRTGVARGLLGLADLFARRRWLDDAELLYRRALAGLPADHPERRRGLGALGTLLARLGRHDEAEMLRDSPPAPRAAASDRDRD